MQPQKESSIITHMFFHLLPVQILLVAITSLNGIIDGAMAGNLIGANALSVTGLFAPIVTVLNLINAVIVGGASILCGQFLGKNQVSRTKSVFTLSIFLMFFLGIAMTAICFAAPDLVCTILGTGSELKPMMIRYLQGYSPGYAAVLFSGLFSVFLQMEQKEKRTYAGIAAMLVLNLVLDYLMVGILRMDMFGLGLSTTISYFALLLLEGIYYFSPKAVIRFSMQDVVWEDVKDILLIGFPGAVTQVCLALRGLYLNHMILRYAGIDGMTAFSALNTFGGLFYAVTAGVAAATRLLVSIYSGEEDRTGLLMVMKTALTKGVALVAGFAAVIIVLAVPLTFIFCRDTASEVYRLTVCGFRLFPVSMPFSCFCVVFCTFFQCMRKFRMVTVLSVVDGVLGTILSATFLLPMMGGMGIWATQILNGVYTTLIVICYAWILNRKVPLRLLDLLVLPESFGVSEKYRIDLTVSSMEEVLRTSEQVIEFCRRCGADNTRSVYAGLCMEEMAGNIVTHGFRGDKSHSVDLRVVYKPDTLLLRLRDDCRAFNPKEKAELFDPEDITHNIGLRMVSRIAKSLNYQNMLGMNVLTIQL